MIVKAGPENRKLEDKGIRRTPRPASRAKLWIGIGALVILSPLGLILPKLFNASGAWGEWGVDEIKDLAGYVPEGMKRLAGLWSAPLRDYAFSGWDTGLLAFIAYIFSGLLGVAIVTLAVYVLGRFLKKDER